MIFLYVMYMCRFESKMGTRVQESECFVCPIVSDSFNNMLMTDDQGHLRIIVCRRFVLRGLFGRVANDASDKSSRAPQKNVKSI